MSTITDTEEPMLAKRDDTPPHPELSLEDQCYYAKMMDWQFSGLEQARESWQRGDYHQALGHVSDHLRNDLSRQTGAPHGPSSHGDSVVNANRILEGKVILLQYKPVAIGEPIDWFLRSQEDAQWTVHLSYMYWINPLATAYELTGDERYAERWTRIITDFLDSMAYGNPRLAYNPSRAPVLNHSKTCNNGESWGSPDTWISLSCHCRAEALLYGLRLLARSPWLTDALLLRITASLMDEHLHVMITNPRENTPNQFLAISSTMVRLGVSLPIFKAANTAFQLGHQRMLRAIGNVMLADGSDMEQSINYNVRFCDAMADMAEYLAPHAPASAEIFYEVSRKRAVFIAALITPLGRTVSLAKTGIMPMQGRMQGWDARLGLPWLRYVLSSGTEGPKPPFTSLAFPYGGYYTLRSDWRESADYLFFKTSEHGLGHMHEDCLSLHISSGGRDLLVDSGNYSYTRQTPLDAVMNDYSESSLSHSTVLVDGRSQCRISLRKRRQWNHDEVPKLRGAERPSLPGPHGSGKFFQFAQGSYEDGYGPDAAIRAVHQRSVVWILGAGWLVLDRVQTDVPREISAIWTLAPGFHGTMEKESWGVHSKVGLTLLTLAQAPIPLAVFDGSESPVAGWFSDQYGSRVPKPDIHVRLPSTGRETLFATLILPTQVTQPDQTTERSLTKLESQVALPGVGNLSLDYNTAGGAFTEFSVEWTPMAQPVRKLVVKEGSATELHGDERIPMGPLMCAENISHVQRQRD